MKLKYSTLVVEPMGLWWKYAVDDFKDQKVCMTLFDKFLQKFCRKYESEVKRWVCIRQPYSGKKKMRKEVTWESWRY